MAQVNCLAQGGMQLGRLVTLMPQICATQTTFVDVSVALPFDSELTPDPSIMLYADGKEIGEYKLDRAYPILDSWIEEKALAYARGEPLGDPKDESWEPRTSQRSRPNSEGKVVEVDGPGLDQLKADGPVFVDFFAPWCSQ